MKKTFKKSIIIAIMFILVLSISNISNAVNESVQINTNLIQPRTTDGEIAPISIEGEAEENTENTESEEDTENIDNENYYNGNYYSFSTQDLTIDQDIYGDAFIFTSGNVTINSSIYGNLFVFANDVIINNSSEIISSIFSFSKTLNMNGIADTNVYAYATNEITISESADITCDLYAASTKINIAGLIDRNVYSDSKSISISDTSQIYGDLNYTANEEISIPENIVIGNINFTKNNIQNNQDNLSVSDVILGIISYIILVIVLYLIYKLVKIKFINNSNYIKENIVKCILFGALSLFIIPIICILLLFVGSIVMSEILSQVAITLLFILLMIYIILLLVSVSTTIISLSQALTEKFKDKLKINVTPCTILFIGLLSIIYKLITLVPILGSIVSIVLVIIGLGIWINMLIPKKIS